MEVARAGELADPRQPAPAALRPVLAFRRLSAGSYAQIQRVIDEDGIFRARVAEEADEGEVGRAGWLWLHRPVGWQDDEAFTAPSAPERDLDAAPAARGDKHRKAAAEADAARRRMAKELSASQARVRTLEGELDRARAEVATLQDERSQAMRAAKAMEADLAASRRDLKLARAATREAEAELLALRVAGPGAPDPSAPEVRAAAAAASALAASLSELAARLGPDERSDAPAADAPSGPSRGGRRRGARRQPHLPPGVFDATADADRHLVADPRNRVVVDGYNVARAAWAGLSPEEERRRTTALLEDLQARSGGNVLVVFDGDTAVHAPVTSKHVRVRFSATGQSADDLIGELVGSMPLSQPVVVVSSDREVADDARRAGAVVIGARAFLAAVGR